MSEHESLFGSETLVAQYDALRDRLFVLPEMDERTLSIISAEELDEALEQNFGISPSSPKLVEKLFVMDFEDQVVWEKPAFIMKEQCNVSSIIALAGDFGVRHIENFELDYTVCMQLYIDGRRLAIRYSQNQAEDPDLVKALMIDKHSKVLSIYEVIFTDKPERVDWSDNELSITPS